MGLRCESEFIFIGRGDESFLENYSYELSGDSQGEGGKIFMALEILNNQAEAEDIGEAIFANFKQKFYEDIEKDPYDRFEEALKVVNQTVEALREEKVSHFIGNFNIALGAVVDDALLISTTGDAEVYLVRKRFVSVVSEGLAEQSQRATFINIANGNLETGDGILFSSSRLLRYITKGELGRIFNEGVPLASALTQLQDFIMTDILGCSAVVGISMMNTQAGELPEVFEPIKKTAKLTAFFTQWFPKIKFSIQGRWPWLDKVRIKIIGWLPQTLPLHKETKSKLPRISFPRGMQREQMLLLILFLLLILVGGTFWMRTRINEKRNIAQQQVKLNHVRELMNDVATTGQFDKTKAAQLLLTAEKEALQILNARFLRGEAVKTLDDIQKQRDSLDEVKRISAPTLLADFSQKRSTVNALGLLSLKDRLYGFEYNALYEMVLDRLQDPLTIHDVETVILGASFVDQNALLFLTRTGKIIEYAGGRFSLVSTKDGIWKKGVDMKSYNDRVYILDPERNQIWRYIRRREGFDIGEPYNQNADLKKSVSFGIDSSVYILNADGTITQLYQGQKQEYPLRRSPLTALSQPTRLYTSAELNYLYILEPSRNRVVIYRKDPKNGGAHYQTQYVFEKVGALRDLVVIDNRLYVMDDKKVYFVNLSGL